MEYMIQFQVQGEESPRVQLLEEESRESAVSLVFNDFFADNPGCKVKLLSALEVIDARPLSAQPMDPVDPAKGGE